MKRESSLQISWLLDLLARYLKPERPALFAEMAEEEGDQSKSARKDLAELGKLPKQSYRVDWVRRRARRLTPEFCTLVLEVAKRGKSSDSLAWAELALEIAWAIDRNEPGTHQGQIFLARAWASLGKAFQERGAKVEANGAMGLAAYHQNRASLWSVEYLR